MKRVTRQSSRKIPLGRTAAKKRQRKDMSSSVEGSIPVANSSQSRLTHKAIRAMVEGKILEGTNKKTDRCVNTRTLGGFCLVDALWHCAKASNGILEPVLIKHGPPAVYIDYLKTKLPDKNGSNKKKSAAAEDAAATNEDANDFPSFRALCRTVAGQQLAGAAANTIWKRLLETVIGKSIEYKMDEMDEYKGNSVRAFTPKALLERAEHGDVEDLRKTAGLSRAKCNCVLAIAESFESGHLSEELLNNNTSPDDNSLVRDRLLSIKGLGPWSVDMFLLFRCHKPNVLPIGDLALRNGTGILWKLKPSKGKSLDAKRDGPAIEACHAPFAPYRSISSYYMYKITDDAKKQSKTTKTKAAKSK